MKFQEFLSLHQAKSLNLSAFNVPSELVAEVYEKTVTEPDIEMIEKEFQINLPTNYKEFCGHFGGGYFGYINVFSLDKTGDWFIFDKLNQFTAFYKEIQAKVLPFSDDQTGGYYCFKKEGKTVEDKIVYVDEMGNMEETAYLNFLDYVSKTAYKVG